MEDVIAATLEAVRTVDVSVCEPHFLPVRRGERIIGIIGELPRRLLALQVLARLQLRDLLAELEGQRAQETWSEERMDSWVARSRALRARISVIDGGLHLALYAQFPHTTLIDTLTVREGYRLVVTLPGVDAAVDNIIGDVFSSLHNPPKNTH